MPLYVADFQIDTMDLAADEIGVYLSLLMLAWRRSDGAIPADMKWLKRSLQSCLAGFHGHAFNRIVPKILARFFVLEDGVYTNKRLTKELQKVRKLSAKQSENVGKRWAKTKENKALEDTNVIPHTHTHTHTHKERDKIVEASGHFTEGSKALASAFWKALGFASPLHIPPQFAGVDWRAVGWETAGWTVDLIEAEARRIGPDKPLSYFEKVFATAFAKRQAPLPLVEIREAQTLTVTHHAKPKSPLIQAADDLCRKLAEFDGPVRQPEQLRSFEGQNVTRLLSNGRG